MNQDQYKCHSYYDDDNILRDCTCGKCEVKIPMGILEIFEGENSGLTNAFREAVAREQSHTEKVLEFESFDSFFAGLPMQEEKNAIKLYEKYIQSFFTSKAWEGEAVKQAYIQGKSHGISEEYERVRGIMQEELKLLSGVYAGLETLPEKSANLAIRDSFIRIQTINQINKNI